MKKKTFSENILMGCRK